MNLLFTNLEDLKKDTSTVEKGKEANNFNLVLSERLKWQRRNEAHSRKKRLSTKFNLCKRK